jgi:hypothetical protein
MTCVSRRGRAICNPTPAKAANTQGCAPLAHRVHESAVAVAFTLLAMMLTGCVIPPSLEVDQQDAGQNSPPAITAVRTDTAQVLEPGPLKIVKSPSGSAGSMNVEVVDTDGEDAVFVRLYVNYTVEAPTPSRAGCSIPAGVARRDCSIVLDSVCFTEDFAADPINLPLLTVKVFDRRLLESGGTPLFQAMEDPTGLATGATYRMDCDEAVE